MAGSVNKVILVGNLGDDPEVRFIPNGTAVANFSVATSEQWDDKEGQRQEKTEWHRIVVWAKLAELCGEYLGKGKKVYVEGRLQTRKWDDKDGNTRYSTEVVAQQVVFLSPSDGSASPNSNKGESARPQGGTYHKKPVEDDDIPF